MKYVMKVKLVIALMLFSSMSLAASVNGHVVITGTYGSGRIFVSLDTTITGPGCSSVRFDVPATHPNIKTILSIAMTAIATGKSVNVQADSCIGSLPSMSESTGSYIFLNSN